MGRSLLLRLEAPSQAWDAHRFHATMSRRPLSRALDPAVLAPTRTGIEGLLRAALGDDTDLSGRRGWRGAVCRGLGILVAATTTTQIGRAS